MLGRTPSESTIVVTGMGAVSPVGNTAAEAFAALVQGKSGIAAIDPELGPDFEVRIAGQVRNFDHTQVLGRKHAKRHARYTHLALAAVHEAVAQSGLGEAGYAPERIGVIFGTGMGGLEVVVEEVHTLRARGPNKLSPFGLSASIPNIAAGMIGEVFNAQGPNHAVASACASGAHAIGQGLLLLRSGVVDAVIVGGSEAVIIPSAIGSFARMQALSLRNQEPTKASRPFDRGRDGFVLGEGAGALVLERYSAAQKRGAMLLGELAGYGASCDSFHVTRPREDGLGAQRAMRWALDDAKLAPEQVDYINAHGTSTPFNDEVEALAIRSVFGERTDLWVSSTKSMSGHLLGAAGAFEAVVSLLALREHTVPPTINLDDPDPRFALDFVAHEARSRDLRFVLSNSFAFGGQNASLCFAAL
jgi:3-oxoacyl-[acyl-carrier-protein] synthase II